MIALRDAAQLPEIANTEVRHLVAQRIQDLSQDEPWDADVLGPFIVVEPGDQLAAVDRQLGFSIMTSRINGAHFGDPSFVPCHEILEEHPGSYEIVFILDDSGYGITVFVTKDLAVDASLLAMCARYAVASASD